MSLHIQTRLERALELIHDYSFLNITECEPENRPGSTLPARHPDYFSSEQLLASTASADAAFFLDPPGSTQPVPVASRKHHHVYDRGFFAG